MAENETLERVIKKVVGEQNPEVPRIARKLVESTYIGEEIRGKPDHIIREEAESTLRRDYGLCDMLLEKMKQYNARRDIKKIEEGRFRNRAILDNLRSLSETEVQDMNYMRSVSELATRYGEHNVEHVLEAYENNRIKY